MILEPKFLFHSGEPLKQIELFPEKTKSRQHLQIDKQIN